MSVTAGVVRISFKAAGVALFNMTAKISSSAYLYGVHNLQGLDITGLRLKTAQDLEKVRK